MFIDLSSIASVAPTGSTPTLLYIFGAICAGGGLGYLGSLIRHWRRGQIEDTELVSRITKDTVAGARDILAEYKLEVELVKRQIEDYRDQLNKLSFALAEANVRISNLERDLMGSQEQRDQLAVQLREAVKEREKLRAEIEKLHKEITELLKSGRRSSPRNRNDS